MKFMSFSQKLFLSVLMLFGVFVTCFCIYQFQREKTYKINLLNSKLQDYNHQLEEFLEHGRATGDSALNAYIRTHALQGLRVTLLHSDGEVFFDNGQKGYDRMPLHSKRPEIIEALAKGQGYVINRRSETTDAHYFYSATYFPEQDIIIRSALPYDLPLTEHLRADMHYIWITLAVSIILTIIFYQYTRRLGKSITQLRRFAKKVDRNMPFDPDKEVAAFPSGELGEISQHIVRIYQHLKQSQEDQSRLKRQLTQNISHELKTPVASIQGYLETIINTPDMDNERRQKYLERCYAQSNRLTNLLRDISALNRMDEVLHSITKETVNISLMVKNILQEVALEMEERDMTADNRLPEDIVMQGDASLIYSIFRNLTDNAIAYAGEGTTITIQCTVEETLYQFSFSDNGIGIAPEHLSRIFERFYRIDKGRSRKIGGTGLGLAIVRNAVILHGGSIAAQSDEHGGLTFRFSLKRS